LELSIFVIEDFSLTIYLDVYSLKCWRGEMKKGLGYGVILAIILLGLTMLAFNTQLCKAQLTGDLDEDGDVDIADLIIVAGAFGTTSIHPRWNEQADLNADMKVNMIDLAIVARNFGSTA
jgi:hypothetical protein